MKCMVVPTGAPAQREPEKMKPDLVVRSLKERRKFATLSCEASFVMKTAGQEGSVYLGRFT